LKIRSRVWGAVAFDFKKFPEISPRCPNRLEKKSHCLLRLRGTKLRKLAGILAAIADSRCGIPEISQNFRSRVVVTAISA